MSMSTTTSTPNNTLFATENPCAQGVQGGELKDIAYWHDGYFVDDMNQADVCDDFDVFGSQSIRIQLPIDYNFEQVTAHIQGLLNPCAQGVQGGEENTSQMML